MAIKRQIYTKDNKITKIAKTINNEEKIIQQVFKGTNCIYENFERFNIYLLACDGGFVENYKQNVRTMAGYHNIKEGESINLADYYNEDSLTNVTDTTLKASGFDIYIVDRQGIYQHLLHQPLTNMTLSIPSSSSVEEDRWVDIVVTVAFSETSSVYIYAPSGFDNSSGIFTSAELKESFTQVIVGTNRSYTYDDLTATTYYPSYKTILLNMFYCYKSYDDMINSRNAVDVVDAHYSEGLGGYILPITITSETMYYMQDYSIVKRGFNTALQVSYYDSEETLHTISTNNDTQFVIYPADNRTLASYFEEKNLAYPFTDSDSTYRELKTTLRHYILNKLTIYDVPDGSSPSSDNQIFSKIYGNANYLWDDIPQKYITMLPEGKDYCKRYFVITPSIYNIHYEFELQCFNSNNEILSKQLTYSIFPLVGTSIFSKEDLLSLLYNQASNFSFDAALTQSLRRASTNEANKEPGKALFEFYVSKVEDDLENISYINSSNLINIFANEGSVGLPKAPTSSSVTNRITVWKYHNDTHTYTRKLFMRRKSLIFIPLIVQNWYWDTTDKINQLNTSAIALDVDYAGSEINMFKVEGTNLNSPVTLSAVKKSYYPGEFLSFSRTRWYRDNNQRDISTTENKFKAFLNILNYTHNGRIPVNRPLSDGYTYVPGVYHVEVKPSIIYNNFANSLELALDYYNVNSSLTKEFTIEYKTLWNYYNTYFNLHPKAMFTDEDYQRDFGGNSNTDFIRAVPGETCYLWDKDGNFYRAILDHYTIVDAVMSSNQDMTQWLEDYDSSSLEIKMHYDKSTQHIQFNGISSYPIIDNESVQEAVQFTKGINISQNDGTDYSCNNCDIMVSMDGGDNRANVVVDIMSKLEKFLQNKYNSTENYTLHENYFLRSLTIEPVFSSRYILLWNDINWVPDLKLTQEYSSGNYYLKLRIRNNYRKSIHITEIEFFAMSTEGGKISTMPFSLSPDTSYTTNGGYLKSSTRPQGTFKAQVKFYIDGNQEEIITRSCSVSVY